MGLRRAVLIALPVAALIIVVAVVATSGVSGSSAGAAATSPGSSKGTGSGTVTRRDLIATDTESGTLGFGDPRTVYNRLSGTITSLPAAGTIVRAGGTLFTVDNAPVVLMNGTVPAYRALSDGVSPGPDVKELEQNLRALGFDPSHAMTIDDTFDSATTAAVDRWQASLGQTQTGTVALGSVVFLPGPRRVSSLTASLGSTGGSSAGSSSGAASAATTASTKPAAHAEFVDLVTSSTSTTTTTSTTSPLAGRGRPSGQGTSMATLQALVALLKAETAELRAELSAARSSRTGAARSGSASPSSGAVAGRSAGSGAVGSSPSGGSARGSAGGSARSSAGGSAASTGGSGASGASGSAAAAGANAQPVLQTTSTELVATVPLDASKQSEAVLGQPVTVQMPDGSTVDGRISQVAAAAQSSSGSSSTGGSTAGAAAGSGSSSTTSTVPVTITLNGQRKTAGLDQAAVSVNFEQQKAAGVLAVPVTALLATAGGGYAIQEAAAPNRLIPVTTGLFAAGYVQISGSGISDGLQVTDSQG